ncbi:MAG: hypothetical protein JXR73_04120 [Candidatus Omnitrophica bacterium]|nr:hypothetical protein [Candidatus Omnitrophota bacterium]
MNDLKNRGGEASPEARMAASVMREKPMFEAPAVSDDDLALINRFAAGRLGAEQVYARSMYLCSSRLCASDGCQFTRTALEEIAENAAGLPVLTGHDRSSLPLARFYKARVERRGTDEQGEPLYFVRAWFYWLRDTSGAKDLLLNIDGGIYREASLAWRYDAWRCSICGAANGSCGHRVGKIYGGKTCCRLIDHVVEVLEGSLVYKSADKDTFLAGLRSRSGAESETPLLLIADQDDPLWETLERAGAVRERHEWSDAPETPVRSADAVWMRGGSRAQCEEAARRILSSGCACLAEILPAESVRESGGEKVWGDLVCLTRGENEEAPCQSAAIREKNDGSVWTV